MNRKILYGIIFVLFLAKFIVAEDWLAELLVGCFTLLLVGLACVLLGLWLIYRCFNKRLVLEALPFVEIGRYVSLEIVVKLLVMSVVIYVLAIPMKQLLFNMIMEMLG